MKNNETWITTKEKKCKRTDELYLDGYAEFDPPIGKVYHKDVAKYVIKHTRFIDRLNPYKMVVATFMSFDILNGALEEPKTKNGKKWKFFPDIF